MTINFATAAVAATTYLALLINSDSVRLVQAQYPYGGTVKPPTLRPTGAPTQLPTKDPTNSPTPPPVASGGELDCTFPAPIDILGDGSLLLRHIVNPTEATVKVQLEYAGIGWLGATFVSTRAMVPNVAIIGLPETKVAQKYGLTAQIIGGVQPLTDSSRQTLTDATIEQDETKTVLTFTKPLVEDDEVAVAAGATVTVMWAHGSSNELAYHQNRGYMDTTIPVCVAAGQTAAPIAPTPVVPAVAPAAAPASVSVGAPSAATGSGAVQVLNLGQGRSQYSVNTLNGISTMKLTTDEAAKTFTVEMVAPVTSWIAFAFSLDNKMPDSVAVMAFPKDDGTAVPEKWLIGGTRTTGAVTRAPDNLQTLIDATAFQNATHTGMKFTKLMQEVNEPTVTLEGKNFFLYASGFDNKFGMHKSRSDFALDFANLGSGVGGGSTGPPNKAKWMAHGILMAVSWAILVPVAVASSVLRGLLPLREGQWFQIHRGLNTLGVTLTIIGFAIAVYCIADEQGASAKHFNTLKHHKVGLVVFLFAFLQALSGIFRPHLPAKPKDVVPDAAEVEAGEDTPKPDAHQSTEKSKARVAFEYQHRILGTVTMILAWYNCDTGIKAYNNRFQGKDLEGALWGVIAAIVVPTMLLSVYQRVRSSSQ
jgi:Eukaryotic cytochrome b561